MCVIQFALKGVENTDTLPVWNTLFFYTKLRATQKTLPSDAKLSPGCAYTSNVAFRHLPPNAVRTGYATAQGALFISAQLSTDTNDALRKVSVLIRLWK